MTVRILMAGGTGLVGRLLTTHLLKHHAIQLDSLVRNPCLPQERQIDFDRLIHHPRVDTKGTMDVGISCLGTTLKAAGSPELFRWVDFDMIVAFARAARSAGARRFILLSSVNAGGRGLYLSIKGETEVAVQALGFDQVDIVRPSLLLGSREKRRPLEALTQRLMPILNPVLMGPLGHYAAIEADLVARAMKTLALRTSPGVHMHHVPDIRRLGYDFRCSST